MASQKTRSKKKYWWSAYGDFPPLDERKLYPHPIHVINYYYAQSGLSLTEFGAQLGVRTREVRYILQEGRNLDRYSFVRKLAGVLNIPPSLLQLSTHNTPYWWKDMGYSFDAEIDDTTQPHAGQVVKHFRQQKIKELPDGTQKSWTQIDLANACEITEDTVCRMEKQSKYIDSIRRRRALAFILKSAGSASSVALLLGLDDIERTALAQNAPALLSKTPNTHSLQALLQEQAGFWSLYFTQHGTELIPHISNRITQLSALLQQRISPSQSTLLLLLCHYHQLLGNIYRETGQYKTAIFHANKSVSFAHQTNDPDLIASSIHRQALLWLSAINYQDHLQQAGKLIDQALLYAQKSGPQVHGHVLADAAMIHAHLVQDIADRKHIQYLFDQAGHILRHDNLSEDPQYINFNVGIFHLRKADAYVTLGNAQDAYHELRLAEQQTSPTMKRRHNLIGIFHASALSLEGEYEEATKQAINMLTLSKEIKSERNKELITDIYHNLQDTSYQNNPALVRLGLKLEQWHN